MAYKNILLIDDDEDDQEIFLTALGKIDRTIICTAIDNAREALDMLIKGKINPDLIFLDLNLPVMNGQQFLMEIKKEKALSDLPIVILSTSSHRATIELIRELGATDFHSKPDSFTELIDIIKTVLMK